MEVKCSRLPCAMAHIYNETMHPQSCIWDFCFSFYLVKDYVLKGTRRLKPHVAVFAGGVGGGGQNYIAGGGPGGAGVASVS